MSKSTPKLMLALTVWLSLNSVLVQSASAQSEVNCAGLPSHYALRGALSSVVSAKAAGGFNLEMWATVVNRDGEVCAVVFTGHDRGDQWPGSRVISAQKASTANAFSLPGLALSTANLFSAVQPGGSLFGLQESNPVNALAAYAGPADRFGTGDDPLTGARIGGVNVFGGGLALYDSNGKLLGAIGVSGDSSCADHITAWRTRFALKLDYVPGGVGAGGTDNMVHDINPTTGKSAGGFGHPECSAASAIANNELPTTAPVSKKQP